jgi:hypothetical protein
LLLLVVGLIGFVVFRTFFAGGAKPTPVPSGPNQEVGQPKRLLTSPIGVCGKMGKF